MQAAKLLLAALALAVGSAAAWAQGAGNARKGLRYAEQVCAECHAVKAGQYPVPAAGQTFKAIANTPA
jgi:mono/diheme cytochrome c family protein